MDLDNGSSMDRGEGGPELPAGLDFSAPTMVGDSEPMKKLRARIASLGARDCTAMVHGETGSGKELVARQLHACSPRLKQPFIAVDCTTLRDTLFESQLFGHTKGAFTGADKPTLGFFRAADGGTIFLDEIGELDLPVQAKLLRVIQERCVTPLGSIKPIPINVRIIAATHRDLKELVKNGTFREDLFFRLNVVKLNVPPLRERPGDVVRLGEHFLAELAAMYDEPVKEIGPDVAAAMKAYRWPGNVRELANAMEHAVALAPGKVLTLDDMPDTLQDIEGDYSDDGDDDDDYRGSASGNGGNVDDVDVSNGDAYSGVGMADGEPVMSLDEAEKTIVAKALKLSDGNQSQAARMLQIERRRLYRMVDRFGLDHLIKK